MTNPEIHPAVDATTRKKRIARHRKWKATRALLIRAAVVFPVLALISALRAYGHIGFETTVFLFFTIYTWFVILVGGWIQILSGRAEL